MLKHGIGMMPRAYGFAMMNRTNTMARTIGEVGKPWSMTGRMFGSSTSFGAIRGFASANPMDMYGGKDGVDKAPQGAKPAKGVDNPAELLRAISRLRKYGITLTNFPTAAMVGPQSSGKSSVLEAFCGIDFLPKKMGMATMKPTHLTTIQSEDAKYVVGDYEFRTIDEFKAEIERLNNNPMVKEIRVEIHAPDLYDCTMLDLPGLFYVSKDNPEMPKQIKRMSEKAIGDANIFPIVVQAAPSDPATNQALQLVQEHDREPHALGVITKTDLTAGQSTVLTEQLLSGELYPLGHGYVALALRNNKQVLAGMTVEQKIGEEGNFFKENPQFRPFGVPALREKISTIQFGLIRGRIPRLISDVDSEIKDLKESATFLDTLLASGNNQLALRLKMMIEKLVGSSLERAEFEQDLRKEFGTAIHDYMEATFGDIPRTFVPEFSKENMDSSVYNYLSGRASKPAHFADDTVAELFRYGHRAPIVVDNLTIGRAVGFESELGTLVPGFDFVLDDPLGKKRGQWGRHLDRYFNGLLDEGHLQREIYRITEDGILRFIKADGCDPLTGRFAEYVVKSIGSKVYQSKIQYAIESAINAKRRPDVSLFEISRHLSQMYPDHFTWHGGFHDMFSKSGKRVKVDVFGEAWNLAYLRAVSDGLVNTAHSQTAVNLLEKMVEGILEMTIDMFNKRNAEQEQKQVKGKIGALKEVRSILSSFQY